MNAKEVVHCICFDDRGIGIKFDTGIESRGEMIRHAHALNSSVGQVAMTARLVAEGNGDDLDPCQQANQVHGLMTAVEVMSSLVEALLEQASGQESDQ
ncbi:hypothetical protein [Luteimonas qiangzhengi]|uniref:hypothetical protein n=1 Tax=Luteimonas sp. MJ146 TaxID=3129240 RepID=UPI0031BA3825